MRGCEFHMPSFTFHLIFHQRKHTKRWKWQVCPRGARKPPANSKLINRLSTRWGGVEPATNHWKCLFIFFFKKVKDFLSWGCWKHLLTVVYLPVPCWTGMDRGQRVTCCFILSPPHPSPAPRGFYWATHTNLNLWASCGLSELKVQPHSEKFSFLLILIDFLDN